MLVSHPANSESPLQGSHPEVLSLTSSCFLLSHQLMTLHDPQHLQRCPMPSLRGSLQVWKVDLGLVFGAQELHGLWLATPQSTSLGCSLTEHQLCPYGNGSWHLPAVKCISWCWWWVLSLQCCAGSTNGHHSWYEASLALSSLCRVGCPQRGQLSPQRLWSMSLLPLVPLRGGM